MSLTIPDIVARLAAGYRIEVEGGDEHDGPTYRLSQPSLDITGQFDQLCRQGWLQPKFHHYELSDAGRIAYMRSTDELGDGKLVAPSENARESQR